MNKELQIVIWRFILASKKTTGEQVNYVDLVKDHDYREQILLQAQHSGNPELAQLAGRIELGLDADMEDDEDFEDGSESILLSEAPDEVWSATRPVAPEPPPTPPIPKPPAVKITADEALPPRKRYAYRLAGALRQKDFSLLHRRALDRFSHKHDMSDAEILKIENKVRQKLQLPPLNWAQELAGVIEDVRQSTDSVANIRSQLHQTYVHHARLAEAQFQRIYAAAGTTESPPSSAPAQAADSNRPFRRWIILAGIVALIGLALILL